MRRDFLLSLAFAVCAFAAHVAGNDAFSRTKLRLGNVLGKIEEYNGKKYSSFRGLRYAKPPVERLRFMPPEPLDDAWEDDLVNFYISY